MKKLLTGILAAMVLVSTSCYKDKGNYDYSMPEEPIVTNIDSVYSVFIGDSLKVSPVVSFSNKARLSYEWRIAVPSELGGRTYTGPELKMVFGLPPGRSNVRLAILDSTNGLKYFYDFVIEGKTAFSTGTTLLTLDGGKSKLSFIKPDGTVVPNVFEVVNNRSLPDGPLQVVPMYHQYINGGIYLGYWITASQESEGGVFLDPNTFKELRTLKNNFFTPPATVNPGHIFSSPNGTPEGVINGKLYAGASQTFYLSPVYGYFGVPAAGDYQAFRKCLLNPAFPFYLGYDVNRKQFIGFTNFGSPSYVGTNYQVVGNAGFNPYNVGLDLINIEQVNANDGYAFGKAADGTIYELKYTMGFIGIIQMTPVYKRAFAQQSLITPETKWQATPAQIFYFTSGDKIYRYNPLNEEIKQLTTSFEGKNVTMIKIANNGNTLIAGVEGALYYLDVSVGKFGDILKKIDGIPGKPVDLASR